MKARQSKTEYHIMVKTPHGWERFLQTRHLDLSLIGAPTKKGGKEGIYHIMVTTPKGWARLSQTDRLDLGQIMTALKQELAKMVKLAKMATR